MKSRLIVGTCAALLIPMLTLSPSPAAAGGQVGPIEFTETEFPMGTPVDGLVVTTLNGAPLPAPLSFSTTDTTADIAGGPGTQQFVEDPGIEGLADFPLTIDFGTNVTSVQFGFAVSCSPAPVADAMLVELLDSQNNVVDSFTVDGLDTGFQFPENQVTVNGMVFSALRITSAICTQPPPLAGSWGDVAGGGGGGAYLFDNMVYTPGGAVPTLPWPALLVLAVLLVGSCLWVLRRRQTALVER